ncbi:MAG: T9SS type A sorting domain-containing protein [Bacteroidales bacterium]|nr:T9SS type A sorting domain-containing protein [Bacteroidales bacterium]
MKKIIILLIGLALATQSMAQVEYLYDFNSLTEGSQNLNGQDGWVTHYQTAPSSQDFDIGYVSGSDMAPDESIAVWYPYGGSGVGRTATRKASPNFNFSFHDGGIMDLEMDMNRTWWGNFFGVGFDSNGDGLILPGMTDADGGVYVSVKGQGDSGHAKLYLPNGSSVEFAYDQGGWNRYKMSFDFNAYDGEGSVTVFVQPGCQGEWIQQAAATNINMHLTPGSGDKNDYQVWDGIFFHSQGGLGGFDNLLVRQQPPGSAQLIDMADIPNQLVFNEPITLQAQASSGLPVSFQMIEGPATISGNVLTLTGATGIVRLKAMQAGDDTWLPAPDVVKTFEVVDPDLYTPEVTLRRPYNGQKLYLHESHPVMVVVSAYIEHPDVIKFTEVKATIQGQEIPLKTDYPDDPENGYYYGFWTPEGTPSGNYDMMVSLTQSGGKTSTYTNSFTVTGSVENQLDVVTMNGDLVCNPTHHSAIGNYAFPSHVGVFNQIMAHYDHNCVNGNCDNYDRVGGVRVRNYRGEWVELFRYITPFGVQCQDDVEVTEFTSLLQGLVEIEFYMETWSGSGYDPTLIFSFTKGTPEMLYVDIDEIWSGTYSFGDYANLQPVPAIDYDLSDLNELSNKDVKLRLITTGHNWSSGANNTYNTGNAAEFYEATHHVLVNGQNRFDQHLWRTCNPNPAGCQPQNGTWIYPRSGWCPGSIAMVWWYNDLLNDVNGQDHAELTYQFDPGYVDYCHPNHPDCQDGITCTECAAPDNPVLRVSGQVVTYSNDAAILTGVHSVRPEPPFHAELFPNPASKQLTLRTDYDKGAVSVLILNSQGQEVMYFTMDGNRTIDVSSLPAGVYVVKMLGGGVVTQKLIIQ